MQYLISSRKRVLSFLISITCCGSIAHAQQETSSAPQEEVALIKATQNRKAKLSYKITGASNSSFGYDIFTDGKMIIRQSSMPGLPGNAGFKTKAGAEKVARLVIQKMQKGEMPPTISKEDMEKLKIF